MFLRLSNAVLAASLAVLMALLVGCASTPPQQRSVGSFQFSDWEGPALKVYMVEPDGLAPDAPVIFVMHGVQRNADDYRDNWIDLAERHGVRIYAPEFSRGDFPGAVNYNLGSVGSDGASAFGAIEPLFAHIQNARGSTDTSYTIFGHSAGAQFVHRFACFAETPNLELAIAANAGWYTLPTENYDWPYGLGGLEAEACTPGEWYAKPLLVMLGDRDADPRDPNLRQTPEARAQGPHRFARGLHFLQTAREDADRRGVTTNWRFEIVEGVAHDNRGMAEGAAALLAESWKDETQ